MNDTRHRLTPEIQDLVCGLVRAGGFPHVAAVAAGIPLKTFAFWMRCAKARRPQPIYRVFYEKVQQAQAQARVTAEAQALKRAPLSWLRYGPGRETGRLPGWTDPVKPAKIERGPHPSIARTQELVDAMLSALEAFPEARAALADALEPLPWLKEEQYADPDAAPAEPPAAPPPEATAAAPGTEPEAQARADLAGASGSVPGADNLPAEAIAPPAADPQPAATSEPAANPQPIDNPPPGNPSSVGNEPATKVQPAGSETAPNRPAAEVKEAPKPPKDGRSWWDRIMAGPWTTVAVWRTD